MNQPHKEWTANLVKKLATDIFGSVSITNEIIDKRAALYAAIDAMEAENAELKTRLAELDAQEPLTASFVQPVPDKCDRIAWRNRYYDLPIKPASVPDIVQKMMARLADLLDEDQFAGMNDLVSSAGYRPPAAPKPVRMEYAQMPPVLTNEMRKIIAQNSTWESPDYLWDLLLNAAPNPDQ